MNQVTGYNILFDKKKKDKIICNETQNSIQIEFNDFQSLNRESAKYVFTRLKKYLLRGKSMIFNLDGIENIDAKGLALLLHLNNKLKTSQKELILTNPSNSIQKIFWITEIDRILKIKKSS